MPRPRRPPPRAHVRSGAWPHAELDGDATAETAQQFVAALATATRGLSLREISAQTGVEHSTIGAVLAGDTWPDIVTLARLEHGLDATLWPTRKREPRTVTDAGYPAP